MNASIIAEKPAVEAAEKSNRTLPITIEFTYEISPTIFAPEHA